MKIDKDSQQLAEALAGEQARIIVTTLQKFPFVLDKIGELPERSYAVIVDEAHSSQTGEAAKDLRMALGATDEQELTVAEAEDAGLVAEASILSRRPCQGCRCAGAPGEHVASSPSPPRPRPGRWRCSAPSTPPTGKYEPFHLYSMRQAIEEGFILDVLANYTTYKTYWRIEKAIDDDPEYAGPKARRAIARFVSLHPTNLAQKAEIIVEHFRRTPPAKIGGRAKAMVVTSSRLHAVRYKQAIDSYIAKQGLHGHRDAGGVLGHGHRRRASSGTPSRHERLPRVADSRAVRRDDYQVLIVAEKFQTGFDQPLLHTMYVDKELTGLNAVQTLSRLNRIHPQQGRHVRARLPQRDRRHREGLRALLRPHGRTTDRPEHALRHPPALSRLRRARPDEVGLTVAVLLDHGDTEDHGKVYAALDPAVERFRGARRGGPARLQGRLDKFVRTYSFLSQVVSFGDPKLERDYIYCRALAVTAPGRRQRRAARPRLGGRADPSARPS